MSKTPSKTTILIIVVAIIFAAYAFGFLDPVIEWVKVNLTLEGQTSGMIDRILN